MGGRYSQKELEMILHPENDHGATPYALDRITALEAATAVAANPGDVARVAEWFAQVSRPGVVARISYNAAGAMTLTWVDLEAIAGHLDNEAVA